MKMKKHLTKEQISMLSESIIEQFDEGLTYKPMEETALMLIEDIAGLECITESEQQELIYDIWADIQQRKS
jgi:hypothetical protein